MPPSDQPSPSSYWLDTPLITGTATPADLARADIVVVGSGLAGISAAYWLQEAGVDRIAIVDHLPEQAASFRNCGHLLPGTVESPAALVKLKGLAEAAEIWHYSVAACELVTETATKLGIDCELRRRGYLTIALGDSQRAEIEESVALLDQFGYPGAVWGPEQLAQVGIRAGLSARFEPRASSMNPVKFRNGLMAHCLRRGLSYVSGIEVQGVSQKAGRVELATAGGAISCEFAVIASNAYAQNMLPQLKARQLAVPFRGQILVSEPLGPSVPLAPIPHSFNHGYEYALRTAGDRLIIGGWRDKIPGMELGDYSLTPNPTINAGLADFARRSYVGGESLAFPRSWVGIMASSQTGLPFVGPTASERIFLNLGFTGHGLPWTHGTGKLLAQIMMGTAKGPILAHLRPPV